MNKYLDFYRHNPEGYWFKRKLYGWGWTPVRWQGVAVLAGYVAVIMLFSLTLDERSSPREVVFLFLLPILLLTATLIRICYRKGEPPRWQWGIPEKEPKE